MDKKRLNQLDALRGIAALVVVFDHYVETVPERLRHAVHAGSLLHPTAWTSPWFWLRFTPLRLGVDGEAAVDLFFVLSGFVLALPLTKDWQPQLWSFFIKRFCRIYIPFAAIILLIAVAYAVIPTTWNPSASHWLNDLRPHAGGYSLTAHLLMTGRDMILDPPMWTLVHEIRMSIFFPVIFLLIRSIGAAETAFACFILSIWASFGMPHSISGSWQATIHFTWMFAVGSALSFHRDRLVALVGTAGSGLIACLWGLAIMLLIVPFQRVWSDFLIGAGAALLIVLCLPQSRVTRVLTSPVPLWLGRISFSLYLIHLPILTVALTSGRMIGGKATILLATFLLAELCYRSIEAPAHLLGIRLSQVLQSRNFSRQQGWAESSRSVAPPNHQKDKAR
ncbi:MULTISPECIES: acyltransferase family protein [Acidiphilium]|uniref:Peptidoglycan/LPS O-acetylase OafA/YrhL, contains acyltransferase and SGNH-hydrolase domains n=1 Tax=Acidiphilium rubrum TaxID=526 RepID=A0A8G2CN00_ACIRU|nr:MULTISPECIES: acyltransferase [Acidiphilium]SIR34341.1 Peptidoglycan/LPS O-acetylase OafA/YrhL, contains acyltransferase and SGNH-hydrolase domains [Acidiphilium rubrum]